MKAIASALLAATLSIGLTGQASAGPDRHWRHDHRPQISHQHHHHYHTPPRHKRHYHRKDWVAPAAILTIGGLAIGTALYHAPQPHMLDRAPPPPGNNWFYCRSSGQYYPYTQACPEGWQAVRPH